MQAPSVLKFATVAAAVFYPLFIFFGVLNLTEGDTTAALALFVCSAVGVYWLVKWWRLYR